MNHLLIPLLVLCLSVSTAFGQSKVQKTTPKKSTQAQQEEKGVYSVKAKVLTVLPDGILCSARVRLKDGYNRLDEPIAIFGEFPFIVDGEEWSGKVYAAGRYQYTAVSGALKTVLAFATSNEAALRRLSGNVPKRDSTGVSEAINPPFGLVWGETAERLERLLKNAKATVGDRITNDGVQSWHVEGLIQAGLKETIFQFRSEKLCAVMLRYSRDDWNFAKYAEFEKQVGTAIARRYGPPSETKVEPDISYKQWNKDSESIRLLFGVAGEKGVIAIEYATSRQL